VIIDAIVLAGGRSSRLDGTPKAGLRWGERTLLEGTLAAVAAATRNVVIVGDAEQVAIAAPGTPVPVVREAPVFAGPAAAIAAGMQHLASLGVASDFTLVLACDMPRVAESASALLEAVHERSDGGVAISEDDQIQPLVGLYSSSALAASAQHHRDAGDLANLSVRALLAPLDLSHVRVPPGATDDIDTRADAERFGIQIPREMHSAARRSQEERT
jgi:molybdopterin-guanine dinucleotide biosynthesis protein A